jgi:rare lipoprotein A
MQKLTATTEEIAVFSLQESHGRIDLRPPFVNWLALFVVSLLAQSCTTGAMLSGPAPAPIIVKTAPRGEATLQKVDLENAPKAATKHALRGEASWYGPGFHGKKTASGEIYDQTKLTAAHKTLPLGSKARVTNLQNGNTVEVQINDRGPFIEGRIIDLSRAAAGVLGFVESGTTRVRLELLDDSTEMSSSR